MIRQKSPEMAPAFTAIQRAIGNLEQQTNANANGAQQKPPPSISSLSVTEAGGIHDIQITDNSPAVRGKNYFAYYSTSPDLSNAHKIDLGASQNRRENLGSGTYYWAAHSALATSDPSPLVYHGGAKPLPTGTGKQAGPPMQPTQGHPAFGPAISNATVAPSRG